MIDFNEMKQRQEEGQQDIDSLIDDEQTVLKHYCSLATEALLRLGAQKKAPVDQVVINSFRTGIALGLRLTVAGGEVQGR
ncbi:unnamed protein product [marine sediment metagenome]|uniref:Uncharacterized protein n=1 Tax=marine sediment metagenome TaxID=412755 RepID=X0YLH5_9ZZZZ